MTNLLSLALFHFHLGRLAFRVFLVSGIVVLIVVEHFVLRSTSYQPVEIANFSFLWRSVHWFFYLSLQIFIRRVTKIFTDISVHAILDYIHLWYRFGIQFTEHWSLECCRCGALSHVINLYDFIVLRLVVCSRSYHYHPISLWILVLSFQSFILLTSSEGAIYEANGLWV